jgi:hypothetical protein
MLALATALAAAGAFAGGVLLAQRLLPMPLGPLGVRLVAGLGAGVVLAAASQALGGQM